MDGDGGHVMQIKLRFRKIVCFLSYEEPRIKSYMHMTGTEGLKGGGRGQEMVVGFM